MFYFNITRMSHLALYVCITFMFNRTERKCFISVMQIGFLVLPAMLSSLRRLMAAVLGWLKSDQPRVLRNSADSARRSEKLMVSSDNGTAKPEPPGSLQGTVSRSWSSGSCRGKNSAEKGVEGWGVCIRIQESFSSASTSMGMGPKHPRTVHIAGTTTMSVPGHIMLSM